MRCSRERKIFLVTALFTLVALAEGNVETLGLSYLRGRLPQRLVDNQTSQAATSLYQCDLPPNMPVLSLRQIAKRNCLKVANAAEELDRLVKHHPYLTTEKQRARWTDQLNKALALCAVRNTTEHRNETHLAAWYAVNAWGTMMMDGQQCCVLNVPPYCVEERMSRSTAVLIGASSILLVLFVASSISACFVRRRDRQFPEEDVNVPDGPPDDRSLKGYCETNLASSRLAAELEDAWINKSCLRALPGHKQFAKSAAAIFAQLYERFDFQQDSVRCQHDNLLSLWRSMCAVVADRAIDNGDEVEESTLLKEALVELCLDMLEGFHQWRRRMRDLDSTADSSDDEDDEATVGLAQTLGQPADLVELIAFLLVWGEAGNVRFMPEALYFLTDTVLRSQKAESCSALYGGAPRQRLEVEADAARQRGYRSGLFLSKVIRPLYNVVFHEWYDRVEGAGNAKDKKVLREGFEDFLPADVANYDDWNELFLNPLDLSECLVLSNGDKLFDHDPQVRFGLLYRMDWVGSLCDSKTHREVHSLWGVFAATHRIVLLHTTLFFAAMVLSADRPAAYWDKATHVGGETLSVRFAAVGLLAPLHGLLWAIARYHTSGAATRRRSWGQTCLAWAIFRFFFLGAPLLTYMLVRYYEFRDEEANGDYNDTSFAAGTGGDWSRHEEVNLALLIHYILSAAAIAYLLFVPNRNSEQLFEMTPVPLRLRIVRNMFWFIVCVLKLGCGMMVFGQVMDVLKGLDISLLGQETLKSVQMSYTTTAWCAHTMVHFMVWSMTFLLFVSDTQLWFTLGCVVLGTLSYFVERRCKVAEFSLEDALSKIPERFSKKVLTYSPIGYEASSTSRWGALISGLANGEKQSGELSSEFPALWDRIVEYMRYEDKIDNNLRGDMSFYSGDCNTLPTWEKLNGEEGFASALPTNVVHAATASTYFHVGGDSPSGRGRGGEISVGGSMGQRDSPSEKRIVNLPEIFREKTACESMCQDLNPTQFGPSNKEVQWRMKALARGLGLPMPRPYRCPYIPGITVLVPHYGESILLTKPEVYNSKNDHVPLIDWIHQKYNDEFRAFTSRQQHKKRNGTWPAAGTHWDEYSENQWPDVCVWTSMRMQTLWRTVAGMYLYLPALQAHFDVQGDKSSALARDGIWDAADCFTLLISMQMYHFFDQTQLEHTNRLFDKFKRCLKVAFISMSDKNETAYLDNIAETQERRYYSCLIDGTSAVDPVTKRRKPKMTIELPGFPILGDGKGDNQNHAAPFTRGMLHQGIDANQGAYFEQMLLLPCAMGEFRSRKRGDGCSKRIIGFPEHITSDIGTIGDLAASAEIAFGTLLQRTYAVLGARMHYGHPDLMNKIYMIQQGGVSKATKTLNLSEDIFAGMDFTLRGDQRKIHHCEYFHLAKGRDLGFNAVLGFFSKLSSGAGEQILTRQMARLHTLLYLPECLTFYYAHVGYYLTQFFVSMSMPIVSIVWLLLLVIDCHSQFAAFESCDQREVGQNEDPSGAAFRMVGMLSVWFSTLIVFFIIMSMSPLFVEIWMQDRLITAIKRILKQVCTLSPLLFIFQSKLIGYYIINELRYGGATYVATGRGLPTERRPFVGKPVEGKCRLEKCGGLYLDYAHMAYYDGAKLLLTLMLIFIKGGMYQTGIGAFWELKYLWLSLLLTVASWLYAPFIFNPYQFEWRAYAEDVRAWIAFFCEDGGRHWIDWYNKNHLKPRKGFATSIIDIGFFISCFWLAVWFTVVNLKLHVADLVLNLEGQHDNAIGLRHWYALVIVPPATSFLLCILWTPIESCFGCSRRYWQRGKHWMRAHTKDSDSEDSEESSDEEKRGAHQHTKDEDVKVLNGEKDGHGCCSYFSGSTPVAVLAIIVVLLDLIEIVLIMRPFAWVNWTSGWVAGVVLKITLLDTLLWVGEGILKSSRPIPHCCLQPVQHWVYAHRMARDLFVSAFIFGTLGFFVIGNHLNDVLLPGCSIHQLLIYRDPGHLQRTEGFVTDVHAMVGPLGDEPRATKRTLTRGLYLNSPREVG